MEESFITYGPVRTFWHKSLTKLSYLYTRKYGPGRRFIRPQATPQESADALYRLLTGDRPVMAARFGSTELNCAANYIGIRQGIRNLPGYIRGTREPWWWFPARVRDLRDFSGFFPLREDLLTRFCLMVQDDARSIDLLASWRAQEEVLEKNLLNAQRIFLPYLEPWYAPVPWTRALAGKRVLVVHPFAPLIEEQYRLKRTDLFANPDILPEFELQTIRAVQTLGGGTASGFSDWFAALQWMETEMDRTPYDICLIGCGAYGLHLAAHAKRRGKKAVHMGGALQLLFGIKGNRWEDPLYGVREWGLPKGFYPALFNKSWVKPGDDLKSQNADRVEGACYW